MREGWGGGGLYNIISIGMDLKVLGTNVSVMLVVIYKRERERGLSSEAK